MKKILFILFGLFFIACSDDKNKNLEQVDLILDWVPNTNHTGLYVAIEKGYFKDENIELNIKSAPEDSTSDLIINNKAPFGIYYQDSMASKLSKGANITAVAAIIENNTSGLLSLKESNINSPKDMVNKKYGSWNDPVEMAMINYILKKNNIDSVKFVPNVDSNSIAALENKIFDFCWIFYAWDGILAKFTGVKTNFYYLKDLDEKLNYYSPIIIANNDYLKNNKEQAKRVMRAIKKGYIYAINNPKESAEILIKYAPELKTKKEFIILSQIYLSKQYATNPSKWGEFDANRWNEFYKWLNDNNVMKNPIPLNVGFTNEYLK